MPAPRNVKTWIAMVIPNVLSAMRVVCAVLFPVASPAWRVGLVVVAVVSDALDGLAARLLRHTTWWGGLLDAASDKVFAATVLIDLVVVGRLTWWQAALLLARDVMVLVIVALLAGTGRWAGFRRIASGMMGKVTTAALFVLFVVLLVWERNTPAVRVLLSGTMLLSVLAAVDYLIRLGRAWQAERAGGQS